MSTTPTSGPARHPHPGKIEGEGSGTEARSAGMAQVEVIVTLVLLAGATAGLWFAWRRWAPGLPALRLGRPARPPRLAPLPTVSQTVCWPDPSPVTLIPGGSSLPIGRSGRSIGRPFSCWEGAGRCFSSSPTRKSEQEAVPAKRPVRRRRVPKPSAVLRPS
jgi:hypothetical protein